MRPNCSSAALTQRSLFSALAASHSFTAARYSASAAALPSLTVFRSDEEPEFVAVLSPAGVGLMFTMHFAWAVPVRLLHLLIAALKSASDIAVVCWACVDRYVSTA